MNKNKILKQKQYYEGYNRFVVYDIQIPSLKPQKKAIDLYNREVMHCKDSVLVLLYIPKADSFIFCQQFRPGVFFNGTDENPYLLECVAGSVDKSIKREEIALQEVWEEAGLKVSSIELIIEAFVSPGITTEKTFIYYAAVDQLPPSQFGGIEQSGEDILLHVIERKKVYQMMDNMELKDVKTLLALNWFRRMFG